MWHCHMCATCYVFLNTKLMTPPSDLWGKIMCYLESPYKQLRDVDLMLDQCWADVIDGGLALSQHWFNDPALIQNQSHHWFNRSTMHGFLYGDYTDT